MAIAYTCAGIGATDTTVSVTYTNDDGFTHEISINIPRLEDGSVDEEYYQEILEGQLRGVENKLKVGVISFTDPNASVGIAST